MLIEVVKWIHVLSAIAAVGANFTYGVWIRRASAEPAQLPFILRSISWIDRRLANPCYGLLLITGLIMVITVPIPLTTPWLMVALILYVAAALFGALGYAPLMRRQLLALETEGFAAPGYKALANRSTLFGVLVTIDVVVIVFLMVVKPAF
jgi:uncharacterized membrane protein